MKPSDYISFVAIVVSVFVAALTLVQARRLNYLNQVPILVIFWDGAAQQWKTKNVGQGPALNVVVAQQTEDGRNLWYNPVSLPAIAPNEEFPLRWLSAEDTTYSLGARYDDPWNRHRAGTHFTYIRDDRCQVYFANRCPRWMMPNYPIGQVRRYWEDGLSGTAPDRIAKGISDKRR